MKITIDLDDNLAMVLAISRGWTPTIEDESQPMVDDEYPHIPNPVTAENFIETIIPPFVSEYVLREGRNHVIVGFSSVFESVKSKVVNGEFDQLILSGDTETISRLVKESL